MPKSAAQADAGDAVGLVVVQIDGLSRPELDASLAAGAMPNFAALLHDGILTLGGWTPLLPPCTPASQAGILHGANDGIPGFRWYEKATQRLLVANHAHDAAEIERRMSHGRGLLADDGASVGNLLAGDAAFSHLTMATIEDGRPSSGRDRVRYTLDPLTYARIVVESIRELAAEVRQARRQRTRDIHPRMPRGWRYGLERVLTNVPLRVLSTELVLREIAVGRSAVYVDFTGYDEIAHHCGPGRPETTGAVRKIDASLGRIVDAMRASRRRYRLVVLSDHGQTLGDTFHQRFGTTLQAVVAKLARIAAPSAPPRRSTEHDDGIVRLAGHLLGGRAAAALGGLFASRPGTSHHRASRVADSRGAPLASPADEAIDDVVVCASGNLGLVYLTALPPSAPREEIDARYPGLLYGLVAHPGIDVVAVRSGRGLVAIGKTGCLYVEEGSVEGEDPLARFGPTATEGLRRIAGFGDSGDLIAIGAYDEATDQVVSFEDLVGSHGGLGGPQGEPFIAHPPRWPLDPAGLLGAPDVHRQLVRWIRDGGADPAR